MKRKPKTKTRNAALAVRQAPTLAEGIEKVLVGGDLMPLLPEQRVSYYNAICKSLGLNPLTKPFAYIQLNGKLVLYALRDCTDQLRKVHGVSVTTLSSEVADGMCIARAEVRDKFGRTDAATGAVYVKTMVGDALANGLMKAETKAKRRATLSICGLGILDETEIETIPDARHLTPNGRVIREVGEWGTKEAAAAVAARKLAAAAVQPTETKQDTPTPAKQDVAPSTGAVKTATASSERIGTVKVDICSTEVLLRPYRDAGIDDSMFAMMKETWVKRMEKYSAKHDTARECWSVTNAAFEKLSLELEELGYKLEIAKNPLPQSPADKPAAKAAPKSQKPAKPTGIPASVIPPSGRGVLTKFEMRKGNKGAFAHVEQGKDVFKIFRNHKLPMAVGGEIGTFTLLQQAALEGWECWFVVEQSGEYWNVKETTKIGPHEWVDGLPVVRREPATNGKLF